MPGSFLFFLLPLCLTGSFRAYFTRQVCFLLKSCWSLQFRPSFPFLPPLRTGSLPTDSFVSEGTREYEMVPSIQSFRLLSVFPHSSRVAGISLPYFPSGNLRLLPLQRVHQFPASVFLVPPGYKQALVLVPFSHKILSGLPLLMLPLFSWSIKNPF